MTLDALPDDIEGEPPDGLDDLLGIDGQIVSARLQVCELVRRRDGHYLEQLTVPLEP